MESKQKREQKFYLLAYVLHRRSRAGATASRGCNDVVSDYSLV